MGKKLGVLALMWIAIIFAYIIIAFVQSPIQDINANVQTDLAATSNMSNYPGALEAVEMFPMLVWFVPAGVGIIATAVILHNKD